MSDHKLYFTGRGKPLITTQTYDKPIVTVENYEKWYSIFALHPDGTVTAIDSKEWIGFATDNGMWVGHRFHPSVLEYVGALFDYYVDPIAVEVCVGRWNEEQLDPRHIPAEQMRAVMNKFRVRSFSIEPWRDGPVMSFSHDGARHHVCGYSLVNSGEEHPFYDALGVSRESIVKPIAVSERLKEKLAKDATYGAMCWPGRPYTLNFVSADIIKQQVRFALPSTLTQRTMAKDAVKTFKINVSQLFVDKLVAYSVTKGVNASDIAAGLLIQGVSKFNALCLATDSLPLLACFIHRYDEECPGPTIEFTINTSLDAFPPVTIEGRKDDARKITNSLFVASVIYNEMLQDLPREEYRRLVAPTK